MFYFKEDSLAFESSFSHNLNVTSSDKDYEVLLFTPVQKSAALPFSETLYDLLLVLVPDWSTFYHVMTIGLMSSAARLIYKWKWVVCGSRFKKKKSDFVHRSNTCGFRWRWHILHKFLTWALHLHLIVLQKQLLSESQKVLRWLHLSSDLVWRWSICDL